MFKLENYDIMQVPAELSRTSRETLREISYMFCEKFWWAEPKETTVHRSRTRRRSATGQRPRALPDDGQILVVTGDHTASRSLNFDNVPLPAAQRLRVVDYNTFRGRPEEMVGAMAVIFCRGLRVYSDWIEYARTMQVPHYLVHRR